jgi:hypothetical protein
MQSDCKFFLPPIGRFRIFLPNTSLFGTYKQWKALIVSFTEVNMNSPISRLKDSLRPIPDPRSKQGISHPFAGILTLVLLGKIARQLYMTHIVEWAKHHWDDLKTPLGFKSDQPPDATTLSRTLAKLSLCDFRQALTTFFQCLLAEQSNLTVAADGKTSKQFHQADGNPIHLLNMFVHDLNLVLAEYAVHKDKTNEESCLRQHAEEFFEKYPFVQLLTGDAAFMTRPLLEVLDELGKDYLFCVKKNQPTVLESLVQTFADIEGKKPAAEKNEKKEAA